MASLIASLGAQILMAQKIGPGQQLDAYFAAIGFPMAWVGGVAVAGTYLLPALILADGVNEIQRAKIAGNGIVAIAAIGILVTLFCWGFFLETTEMGRNIYPAQHYNYLITLCFFIAFISVLPAAWGAVGNAKGRVAGTILLSSLPPAHMAAYLLFAHEPNVAALAGAQMAGISIQAFGLAWIYRRYWNLSDLNLKSVLQIARNMPLAACGSFCFSAFAAVDAWFAPNFEEGLLSHEALAQRLVIAFTSILSAGPFMLAPSMAATLIDEGRPQDVWRFTYKAGITLIAFCLFASVLNILIGQVSIGLLFQRGSFRQIDTEAVSTILSTLLVGAGPMLASAVAFRVMHVMNKSAQVAILSIAWVILYIIFANIFSAWSHTLPLAISYVVTWGIVSLATYFLLARSLGGHTKLVMN